MSIGGPPRSPLQMPLLSNKKIDLYDFYSVLLPGLLFFIFLFPVYPSFVLAISNIVVVIGILLVVSYVIGRVLHASAADLREALGGSTYEEKFTEAMNNSEDGRFPRRTIDFFKTVCNRKFPHTEVFWGGQMEVKEDQLDALYTSIYSYLYFSPRSLSQTFRALFAFNRTMELVSVLLAIAYGGLLLGTVTNGFGSGIQLYQSVLMASPLNENKRVVLSIGAIIFLVLSILFEVSTRKYIDQHIRYLIIDVLILQATQGGTDSVSESFAGDDRP